MKECQSQWHHHVAMLLVGIALLAPLTSAENARELGLLGPGCFLWRIHRKSRSVLPHANNLCSVGVTRSEEGKTPHRRNFWVANTQKKMLTASGIHSTCYLLCEITQYPRCMEFTGCVVLTRIIRLKACLMDSFPGHKTKTTRSSLCRNMWGLECRCKPSLWLRMSYPCISFKCNTFETGIYIYMSRPLFFVDIFSSTQLRCCDSQSNLFTDGGDMPGALKWRCFFVSSSRLRWLWRSRFVWTTFGVTSTWATLAHTRGPETWGTK